MMKKLALLLLSFSLLFSGAVYAGADDDRDDDDKYTKEWLEKALKLVKDPEKREELKRAWEHNKNDDDDKRSAWQIVKRDKEALSISYSGSDTAKNVTLPLVLPARGKLGSTIKWNSSRPDVISHDGKIVNRPFQSEDIKVTLKATITKNGAKETKTFQVIVKAQLTDAQRVTLDKAALTIGFNKNDNASRVTADLKLAVVGENGSSITWTSSAASIISHDGKIVNRPTGGQGDATVTLTAVIRSGSVSDAKTFTVIVKEHFSDAQRVAADKAALTIGFNGSDNANSVTTSLNLQVTGANGSKIAWISSDSSIISNNGKTVNRPSMGRGDAAVTMFAIINSRAITDVKSFTVVVKQQWNDSEKVAADKAALTIGFSNNDNANSVTSKLTLPTVGVYGSKITWVSSAPTIVATNGNVTRPTASQGDAIVNLIATMTSSSVTDVKTFTIIVKQQFSDEQKVAADKAALAIGYNGSDNAGSVTSNIKLPLVGVNGSTVLWFSNQPQIVSQNGIVTRPANGSGDKSVVLTAVIINNVAVDWKEFVVVVKQKP